MWKYEAGDEFEIQYNTVVVERGGSRWYLRECPLGRLHARHITIQVTGPITSFPSNKWRVYMVSETRLRQDLGNGQAIENCIPEEGWCKEVPFDDNNAEN